MCSSDLAKLLTAAEPLQTFRWSSFGAYLAPPAQRPAWLRVDRLLGEHGMTKDNAAGRLEFGQRMEHRRVQENEQTEWQQFPQGWFLGGAAFKAALLERMAGNLSEYHTGEERRESAQAKAERIIQAELKQRRWQAGDLARQRKGDPIKVKLAGRLRQETTVTIKWIAEQLHIGSWKHVNHLLSQWKKVHARRA